MPDSTVGDLSERALVARIQARLAPPGPFVQVGIGDDAAVVEAPRNRLEVVTTDAIIDGVHFDLRCTPPDAIGHRALAVNLSDLAAMGASPRMALLSLMLPPALPLVVFDGLIDGVSALAAAHRVSVVGGNLASTPGPLTLDVVAIGVVKPRGALLRSGARAGDDVYLTGTVGGAAAGLAMVTAQSAPSDEACRARYLRPTPRVRVGELLGRNRAATSCIDLSDGLADALARIAEASGVGITVNADAIPVEPGARAWSEAHGRDPLSACWAGDDYELLFTASPRRRGRLAAVAAQGGLSFTRIGTCTETPGLRLQSSVMRQDGALPHGFSHFAC